MVLGSDLRRGNATGGRRAAGRGTAVAAALALAVAPALAACSDGGYGGGSQSTPATSAPATVPADRAAAEKEIKQNWQKFFDPNTSTQERQALLENGDRLAPVLEAFSGDARANQVQSQVTNVEFTSATEANVTYTLTLKGATVLPNASGTSVEQDGTWKISAKTLCALVQMSGNASQVPGC
ncbi:hypothetical protein [Streptomyces sp. NPDC058735]|uniref:hypothetical protein n=1 Tax=unclassified Streptomyces TaxID=2593676 RepID=UPI0036A1BF00